MLRRLPRETHRRARGLGARAGNEEAITGYDFARGVEQRGALALVEERRFSRGAGHGNTVDPSGKVCRDVVRERDGVDVPRRRVKRGHHRAENPFQLYAHGNITSFVVQ
jgi:hypothetical protein